jgi:ribosomal protein S18 acetylase RimI-like enzyme
VLWLWPDQVSRAKDAKDVMSEIRELHKSEIPQAAALLGRSMRDNPINVQAFGGDAARRERALAGFFEAVLRRARRRASVLATVHHQTVVAVAVQAPPGQCQPTMGDKLAILPAVVLRSPWGTAARVVRWTGQWSQLDLNEPHWHLGPLAVDVGLQCQGIGGAMLRQFCERLDDRSEVAYLETDKPANVRLYERFAFIVTAQRTVLGVPNWFMRRSPRAGSGKDARFRP